MSNDASRADPALAVDKGRSPAFVVDPSAVSSDTAIGYVAPPARAGAGEGAATCNCASVCPTYPVFRLAYHVPPCSNATREQHLAAEGARALREEEIPAETARLRERGVPERSVAKLIGQMRANAASLEWDALNGRQRPDPTTEHEADVALVVELLDSYAAFWMDSPSEMQRVEQAQNTVATLEARLRDAERAGVERAIDWLDEDARVPTMQPAIAELRRLLGTLTQEAAARAALRGAGATTQTQQDQD